MLKIKGTTKVNNGGDAKVPRPINKERTGGLKEPKPILLKCRIKGVPRAVEKVRVGGVPKSPLPIRK